MYDFFINLLTPIMWGEAWVMTAWHKLFTLVGIPETSGWGWALSIVGLTAVVRFLMIPLFVKQIQSSRKMQLIQPEMQKIQKKYKDKKDPESRQKMTQETMELYKRTGSNPFSSCLPILLQSPFFFALFQLLNNLPHIAKGTHAPVGPITPDVASIIEKSSLFGAQLSSTFVSSGDLNVKILTAVLIVLMSLTTFTTQRQLMRKNMPASALDNPFMKQQKIILYLMPVFFLFSGINFPIGVLLYWLTTNAWSMGQQFYVIRRMPAPGSEAEREYEARQARRGKTIKRMHVPGLGDTTEEIADIQDAPATDAGKLSGQRQQPKGKKRNKKAPPATARTPQDTPVQAADESLAEEQASAPVAKVVDPGTADGSGPATGSTPPAKPTITPAPSGATPVKNGSPVKNGTPIQNGTPAQNGTPIQNGTAAAPDSPGSTGAPRRSKRSQAKPRTNRPDTARS